MDMNRILARHLAGRSSPDEEAELLAWVSADPARAEHLERLRDAWAIAGARSVEDDAPDPAGAADRYGSPADAWADVVGRIRAASAKSPDAAGGMEEMPAVPKVPEMRQTPRRPEMPGGPELPDISELPQPPEMPRIWSAPPPAQGTPPAHSAEPVPPVRRRQPPARPLGPLRERRVDRRGAIRGVAAVLVLAACALLARAALSGGGGPELHTYATAAGERKSLVLSDGSRIMLGPESEIGLPRGYGRRARSVELSGTAFFDVAPDDRRPFHVRAGATTTRVLGTRFGVRAYPGGKAVEVAVEEGRVELRIDSLPSAGAITLGAGQVGEMDSHGTGRMVESASPDRLLAWTRGRLVFNDEPLAAVARELERWYGVEIRIADPDLAARRITLSFAASALDPLLALIALTVDADVQRTGRTAVFQPRRAG